MSTSAIKRSPAGAALLQESITEAIAEALLAELAATGYARTSMEAIARRAKVGKAALYRRWPCKDAMLIDLLGQIVRDNVLPAPDTGSLHGDLSEFLAGLSRQLSNPLVAAIGPGLLAEMANRSELGDQLLEVVRQPRIAVATTILQKAIDRGELPKDLHTDVAFDLIAGPLAMRLLILGGAADDYLPALVSAVEAALRSARRPARPERRARKRQKTVDAPG
ncbi:TetR/AcrR family transcriptional regulator [Mycobacterium sp.]|uniref:TetR/AcrR family transcriptional regulator n=1 Tax=Mycobacterium sp. TaxID=1785 RepID=UPI003D6C1BC5